MDSFEWLRIRTFAYRWRLMMDRCYDPECKGYSNYGGRGIKVCPEWHDMHRYIRELPDGFFEGAHLDRIDNNGDYQKDNVRWITARDNHNNRRTSIPITHNGKTQTLSEWARELGVTRGTLDTRMRIWGWSVQKTLETPPLNSKERMVLARAGRWGNHVKKPSPPPMKYRKIEYMGSTLTLTQLSEACGVSRKLLAKRIFERGWPVEKAVLPSVKK